ncbi:Na+/H+ antiporter NhaA [Chitinophaga sp. GCM10012297]|uniref:Na(+)/H(+) antiporter NhaA n=1 Tax=Chitinophaga chungangae TaxID=2821488 RepID=A0ABS3YA05_9BACT|nr:Na+/H+ antiporter NhaA [Chitinophaga chungangae]MBO9151486.1 Na+/H+ antiporter NhaA [Chitinophaga chungangae]
MKLQQTIKQRVISPIFQFLQDSRAVGIILIVCTIISMLIANSAWREPYIGFFTRLFDAGGGHHLNFHGLHLPNSWLLWINDGFMAFFFFLVGMEIKRELTTGELASFKKALLPALAAVGGMAAPALIYALFNHNTEYHQGWGIPMATDIAFSLGIISLLGKRVPLSLKVFLTALAIIDDLGAILTIALFYTDELHTTYLYFGAGIFALLLLLNYCKVKRLIFYFIPGILLWYCLFNSGIHATIAGVLLAFTIPLDKINNLEHTLHDPVNFLIMPVFALANTAIPFPADILQAFSHAVSFGIMTGLVLGKPLGIFLFCFVAVKLRLASLPAQTNWKQLWGVGMIAGIGFTMSIFIAGLAFDAADIQIVSIMSVIAASAIASVAGFIFLRLLTREPSAKRGGAVQNKIAE